MTAAAEEQRGGEAAPNETRPSQEMSPTVVRDSRLPPSLCELAAVVLLRGYISASILLSVSIEHARTTCGERKPASIPINTQMLRTCQERILRRAALYKLGSQSHNMRTSSWQGIS